MTWTTNLELLPRFNIADVEKWADEGCRIPWAVLLKKKTSESDEMTTLYHTFFVDRMYSLEHNNMTSLLLWLKAILPGFFPPEPRFRFQNGGCVKSAFCFATADFSERFFSLCEFPVDYLDCLYSSDRLQPAFWISCLSAACPDLCIVPVHVWALPTLLLLRLTELCLPDLLLLLIKLHLDLNITDSSLQLKLKLAK